MTCEVIFCEDKAATQITRDGTTLNVCGDCRDELIATNGWRLVLI